VSAAVIPREAVWRGTGRTEGATPAEAAAAIARLVERLTPDRRDPERFHLEKSEVIRACRRLARALEMPR
jgi:phage tail tape-measure protein